jgi:hypothetical protein
VTAALLIIEVEHAEDNAGSELGELYELLNVPVGRARAEAVTDGGYGINEDR